MATVKVSALTEKTSPSGSEELLINDGGTSKKITIGNAFTDTNTTYTSSDFTHDDLTGFVSNEHIDWTTDQGATNIHSGNYTDTNTTYTSSDFTHDSLSGVTANEHIDWTGASAGTIHSSNYTDTNTTYSVQDGELSENNFTDADHTKLNGIEASADVTDATNVTSAGALMDSEVTNLADVKAFDTSDYATAAQGTTADAALPKAGGTMTGALDFGDNVKANFGASDDLQIWHSAGVGSYIKDAGEGQLYLQGSDWIILEDTDGNNMVACQDGAAVTLYHNGAAKLATTSTGVDITGAVTVNGSALASGLYASVAILCDEKAYNVSGGTFTSGAWRTRDLNTEVSDADGIVSIWNNHFILGAGTYTIDWSAPAYAVNFHTTVLYDITNTLFKETGMAIHSTNPNDVYGVSSGSATVTISGSTVYEIRHQCSTTQAGNGFGVDIGFSGGLDKSIYTIVKILKHS